MKIFHALDHEKRLEVLSYISEHSPRVPHDNVGNYLHLTNEDLSHHLKVLLDAGLIESEWNRGSSTCFYSVTDLTKEMLEKYK